MRRVRVDYVTCINKNKIMLPITVVYHFYSVINLGYQNKVIHTYYMYGYTCTVSKLINHLQYDVEHI